MNNRNDKEKARKGEFATLDASRWLERISVVFRFRKPFFARKISRNSRFWFFAFLHFRDFSLFDFCQKIFLPSHSIKKQVRAGRMVQIQVEDLKYMTNVNLYFRRDPKNMELYETFFKALQQQSLGG